VKAAAAQGYAPAQYYLGAAAPFAALAGEGQTQENTEAMGWLRKAAEQGYAPAQLSLGLTYRAQRDDKGAQAEAARWFEKAAEQGNADAEAQLAQMYQRGDGVPEDPARAIALDRKAAEQGNLVAQAQLALLYAAGQGAPPDMVQAYMWAAVADEPAKGTPLAGMQSKLVGTMSEFAHVSATQEQIASGRQMAAEWVKRHPRPRVGPEDVVPMWVSVRN
jgi:TPR repeat protein